MPGLIRNRRAEQDTWTLLRECSCSDIAGLNGRDIIVPLACWQQCRETLESHEGGLGVWLDSHELPSQLGEEGLKLPLIALNFPVFRDGRGFSSARELRVNLGYKGELRAVGDVLRDQLFYMARCGFDSFLLREDQDIDEALRALGDFREAYQASPDQPLPLFRRRAISE